MKNLKYALIRFDFLDQDEIKNQIGVLALQKIEKGSRNNGIEYYKILKVKSKRLMGERSVVVEGEVIYNKNRETLFYTAKLRNKITGNREVGHIIHVIYQKDVDRDIYTGFALYDNIAETAYSEFQFVN